MPAEPEPTTGADAPSSAEPVSSAEDEWNRSLIPPIHDHIGLVMEEVGPRSRVVVPLTDAIRGAVAPAHGGILATIADVACAAPVGRTCDFSKEFPVSTELSVRYYSQPRTSPLIAEAEVVHHGRRLIGCECVIRDGDGRQVARATGTYMIVPLEEFAGAGDR